MLKLAMLGSGGVVGGVAFWNKLSVVGRPRLHKSEEGGCGMPMRLTVLMSVEFVGRCAGASKRF